MIAAAGPSPLWFATRGAGTATLLLLTATLTLGVLTASGSRSWIWPRFLSAGLHRNLSLFTVVFLLVHITTAVADPYAKLGWRDATIPFVSPYRPLWLGLGVVAGELLLTLVVTSLIRPMVGHPVWRAIHWLAYVSWPVGLLHSLGTGSDAKAAWSIALAVACTVTVVGAISWRLSVGTPQTAPLRVGMGVAMAVLLAGTSAWAADGPLRAGWAKRAGTPTSMIAAPPKPSAAAQPTPSLPAAAIEDEVAGSYVHLPNGQTRLVLTDLRDPSIQLIVQTPGPNDPGPIMAIVHNGAVGCIARVGSIDAVSAICGKTRVQIVITQRGDRDSVSGLLTILPA